MRRPPIFLAFVCSVVAYCAFVAFMVGLPLQGFLAHTASDDAFYYLEIASRFGESAWPTFDGLHRTTGFHPLWQVLLVPLAWVFQDDPWLLARVAVGVSALALLAAALVFARLVGRLCGPEAGYLTGCLFLGSAGIARFGLLGMEAPLAMALLGIALDIATRAQVRWWLLGITAGMAVLARLDMVLPLGVGLLLTTHSRWPAWKGPVRAIVAASLVVLPVLVLNVTTTGHLTTISAATKSASVSKHAHDTLGGRLSVGYAAMVTRAAVDNGKQLARTVLGGPPAAALAVAAGDHPSGVDARKHIPAVVALSVLLAAFAVIVALRVRPRATSDETNAQARVILAGTLVVGAVLHFVAQAVLLPGQTGPWYYGIELLAVVVGSTLLACRVRWFERALVGVSLARLAALVILLVALSVARGRGRLHEKTSFCNAMMQMAGVIDRVTEPGARIGSRNAGLLGFASSRTVVNLDGLVNDWEYYDAVARGDVRAWMALRHIRYFADCASPSLAEDYRKRMGYGPEEVQVIYTADGGTCQAFLWRLGE